MKKATLIVSKIYQILNIIAAVLFGVMGIVFIAAGPAIQEAIRSMTDNASDAGQAAGAVIATPIVAVVLYTLEYAGAVVGFAFMIDTILAAVFATKLIKRVQTAKTKKEVIGWGVVNLIFGNTLAGIFSFTIPSNQFEDCMTAEVVEEPEQIE